MVWLYRNLRADDPHELFASKCIFFSDFFRFRLWVGTEPTFVGVFYFGGFRLSISGYDQCILVKKILFRPCGVALEKFEPKKSLTYFKKISLTWWDVSSPISTKNHLLDGRRNGNPLRP